MKSATSLAAVLLASLASLAHAGQRFTYANPIANGSYANSMFETNNLFQTSSSPIASIQNFYTGNVTLTADSFSSTGDYLGSDSRTARYFLSKSSASANSTFSGSQTSGVYATGSGQIIFTSTDLSTVYLRIAFTSSALTYGNFFAAQGLTFSGSSDFFHPGDSGNENAAFALPDRFTQNGNSSQAHHTSTFSASIGRAGVVPEPAPIAAFSFGALALLRRRRRS